MALASDPSSGPREPASAFHRREVLAKVMKPLGFHLPRLLAIREPSRVTRGDAALCGRSVAPKRAKAARTRPKGALAGGCSEKKPNRHKLNLGDSLTTVHAS